MRLLLLLLMPFGFLFAQNGSPFGFELSSHLFLVDLPEANTEASTRTSYGISVAGVTEIKVNEKVRFETGVQLGFSSFSQRVIQRDTRPGTAGEVLRSVAVDVVIIHFGAPAFIKYSPLGDTGPYLKAGFRAQLNSGPTITARLTDPDGTVPDEPTLFPGGDTEVANFSFAPELGLGYRFYGRDGRPAYFEINYARQSNNVLNYAGLYDGANRPNLLESARASAVGITLGTRFGR